MFVSFLRVLILYPIVVFGVRLMGKRQIGELQPAELVITILISNIATLPLEDQNLPLLMGITPMLLLICFEVLLARLGLRSRRIRHLLAGGPQVIIRGGKIDRRMMTELRFTLDDLMTALRSNGVFDLRDVQFAVVETNGTVSVCQKANAKPLTPDDLHLHPAQSDPPEVLIADGSISEEGLKALGSSEQTLLHELKRKHLTPEQVFLLTADRSGICTLIRKEDTI